MTLLSVLSVLTTYHLRNTHYWYYCLSSNPPIPAVPPLGTLNKMTQTWDFWDAGGLHKHNLLVSSDLK